MTSPRVARGSTRLVTEWRRSLRFVAVGTLVVFVVILNAWGLVTTIPHLVDAGHVGDWEHLSLVNPSDPYANDFYRWAPPAIWIWRDVVLRIGFWPIFALHFAVLALLRPWWLPLVVVASWPFWSDAINGSTLTFVAVSASLALSGNRCASIAYIGLFALMPRPLMLPVLAWLLLHRPETRYWLLIFGATVLIWSAAIGELAGWLIRLTSTSGSEMASIFNFGPSAWIGAVWVPIGVVLAVWFTIRERLGLASLSASPYWFGYYLLMLVLEAPRRRVRS